MTPPRIGHDLVGVVPMLMRCCLIAASMLCSAATLLVGERRSEA